ncbi:MAG: glutamine-hydrolyzing carbamoyl-phosphate synthase small subunit, partial [Microbacteriaceae bacterium]
GTIYRGHEFGASGKTFGELVFATAMTGYPETITDPSYAGQILIQTAPHFGNTGVNADDNESAQVWIEGYVVRDPSRVASNFRSEGSLEDMLTSQDIIGICDIDTRALALKLRSQGVMRAGIFSGEALNSPEADLLVEVQAQPLMSGASFSAQVSTKEAYTVPAVDRDSIATVAVIDLGVKRSTLEFLTQQGFTVEVLPQDSSFADIQAVNADAVFYSNGPGDPSSAEDQIMLLREVLDNRLPFFGICFGNQLLGRALGLETYKLPFGHRGINQPVKDQKTGRVEITSQNHGFAVSAVIGKPQQSPAGYGMFEVSHYSLNDQVVEGIRCLDIPAFSVQYHPESAAGPHDSQHLFQEFRQLVLDRSKKEHN